MLADRKYALLQASAVIFAETLDHNSDNVVADLIETAVTSAEALLGEIERREMERTLEAK